jgi:hypothetical protein
MTDPEAEERFTDPARLFEDARAEKLDRRRALHEALAGGLQPEPSTDALEELADAVAQRLLERMEEEEPEPEPEPDPLTGAALHQQDRKQALRDLLTGRTPAPEAEGAVRSSSFDGGARASVPRPPEGHDELIARLALEARTHRGGGF